MKWCFGSLSEKIIRRLVKSILREKILWKNSKYYRKIPSKIIKSDVRHSTKNFKTQLTISNCIFDDSNSQQWLQLIELEQFLHYCQKIPFFCFLILGVFHSGLRGVSNLFSTVVFRGTIISSCVVFTCGDVFRFRFSKICSRMI